MMMRKITVLILVLAGCSILPAQGRDEAALSRPVKGKLEEPRPQPVGIRSVQTQPAQTQPAQNQPAGAARASDPSFDAANVTIKRQLEEALAALDALRKRVENEKNPLNTQLGNREGELRQLRAEFQVQSTLLDNRVLELNKLKDKNKKYGQDAAYLTNLLEEFRRNFETSLHIVEIQRYRELLDDAKNAPDNQKLSEREVYEAQTALLTASLNRLHEALGGVQFEGTVAAAGHIKSGKVALVGPAAVFLSEDGQEVGTVDQRLGSTEPNVTVFKNPKDAAAVKEIFAKGEGGFPLDPTLGKARLLEETKETFWEHIRKGGVVMYPIFALAGAALLAAVYKWACLMFLPSPSQKRIRTLLSAVAARKKDAALEAARAISGPAGKMLTVGVEHLEEPRDLVEEVMYERILATRLKVRGLLPFISITAASAPLLGLLGTVTGIITTFQQINALGTGDASNFSGGISEALITTKFGLIVAIPALLLHAFLSRKARGVTDQMEKAAIALANQVSKTPYRNSDSTP